MLNHKLQHNKHELRTEQPANAGKEYNFWRTIWQRLLRHRMATYGGIILIVIYFLVILAGFISPYGYRETFKEHFFHHPTKIHFSDEDGLSWPYVYATSSIGWGQYQTDLGQKYPLKLLHRGSEYKFFGLFRTNLHLFGVEQPAHIFLLGTDNFGRDVFSRLLYGGRVSMFIGIGGIIISLLLGMLVGGISGYYGGITDNLLMRIAEVFLMIPQLYLLLAIASILPPELTSSTRFFLIVIILALVGWAGIARVIRGMVLAIKNEEYVQAARALGASDSRIIWRHILPGASTYIIVRATLAIPFYILMESGLSFLGLGIQEPSASWGNMLSAAQSVTKIVSFPWMLIPGLMIFIAVLCFNLLGDGLRDALDPKASKD